MHRKCACWCLPTRWKNLPSNSTARCWPKPVAKARWHPRPPAIGAAAPGGPQAHPFTSPWNERARQWRWEVNLIGSRQVNAFCMPGGKIAFYSGILDQLQLSIDEIAMIMGHEMAHALREHARERVAKTQATSLGLSLGAQLLGLGEAGQRGGQPGHATAVAQVQPRR